MENYNVIGPKRSLMTVLEKLECKANTLLELAIFSDDVVQQLYNPRQIPQPTNGNDDTKVLTDVKQVDLIDLFDLVADRIESATNRIGNNTEQIMSFIK